MLIMLDNFRRKGISLDEHTLGRVDTKTGTKCQ